MEENKNKMELSGEQFEQLLKRERANGRGQGALIAIAAIAAIFLISAGAYFSVKYVMKSKSESFITNNVKAKSEKIWDIVEKRFLWDDQIDPETAVDNIYKGIVASLNDPYTVYYTQEEYKNLLESFEASYSGIGAYVSQDVKTGETYISKPMPGSPAEEAGLLPNDRILEVNGESTAGQDLNLIVSKIKGPEGTTVDLTILSEGETETKILTIERRTIEIIRVEGEMLDDGIGYIRIEEFEMSTVDQFDEIYDRLIGEGMKGLIVDLRDNPGGDLQAVINLADEFLDKGIILCTKDKHGKVEEIKADGKCKNIPMVALVNANTASAAEIFSGSLKERGVATIIGTVTFGKGIVQSIVPLSDGSGIKITESEYFLEHDTKIHGIGVTPDIEIELDKEAYINEDKDNQLDKAIEVMKGKLK